MASSAPSVALMPPMPAPGLRDPAVSPNPAAAEASSRLNRRSRILSPPDTPTKRLSMASNPSREAPKPSPSQLPLSSSPGVRGPSPCPSPNPSTKGHTIPSFPTTPQPSTRISIISLTSPPCDNDDDGRFRPQFASSLSYASVRDFAYPPVHPLHYGPTMAAGATTPGVDLQEAVAASGVWFRRLSDPAVSGENPWGDDFGVQFRRGQNNQPPPLNFADGPPWSEDEDLQSPVVVPKHAVHRKHKSSVPQSHHSRAHNGSNTLTPTQLQHFPGTKGDWAVRRRSTGNGSDLGESYYRTSAGPQDLEDGEPGGELYHLAEVDEYNPHSAGYYDPDYVYSDDEGPDFNVEGEDSFADYSSRFSRDYQFTIASPAEEMHGKAVALFDFIQENENELPLVEGQVVWVSYRHGMGWLVAEDPKTRESGLVPEEYVCLLRDMHPGPDGHMEMNPSALVPDDGLEHHAHVSHFSTSSRDVHPYGFQVGHEDSKERLEQIRKEHEERERDAAATEDEDADCGTPKLGSIAFEAGVRANGRVPGEEEMDAAQEEADATKEETDVVKEETALIKEEIAPTKEELRAEEIPRTTGNAQPAEQKSPEIEEQTHTQEKPRADEKLRAEDTPRTLGNSQPAEQKSPEAEKKETKKQKKGKKKATAKS